MADYFWARRLSHAWSPHEVMSCRQLRQASPLPHSLSTTPKRVVSYFPAFSTCEPWWRHLPASQHALAVAAMSPMGGCSTWTWWVLWMLGHSLVWSSELAFESFESSEAFEAFCCELPVREGSRRAPRGGIAQFPLLFAFSNLLRREFVLISVVTTCPSICLQINQEKLTLLQCTDYGKYRGPRDWAYFHTTNITEFLVKFN